LRGISRAIGRVDTMPRREPPAESSEAAAQSRFSAEHIP
jgi:hypothetical protein